MRLRIHLKHPRLLSLSLLLLAGALARAETAADFFHGGAMFYLSNNIPAAKQVVTNGMQQFPDDEKLKKLWELLNQQQQSQSQQQQQQQKQDQQQQDEQKQDEKKDEQQEQPQPSKDDNQKQQQKEMQAHAMTPEEAKQLLDAQKGDEQVLQFRPQEPKNRGRVLKDW